MWATTWQNQQNECAPSEDSDQLGHPTSLIRGFAVRMEKAWVLSYPLSAQRKLWSDWASAQADLSLRWAHSHIVGFVMSHLMCMWQAVQAICSLRLNIPFTNHTVSTTSLYGHNQFGIIRVLFTVASKDRLFHYREPETNYVNISHESKTACYSETVFWQWMHLIG